MNEKVKRINVYLTKEERETLTSLKYKYKLSISTIADIIAMAVVNHSDPKIYEAFLMYNDSKRENQTSIKPRFKGNQVLINNQLYFYTNVIKLWLHDDFIKKAFLTEKQVKRIEKEIRKGLNTTKETNWDGNEWNRKLPKFLKQNKEYYKKILEDM